MSQRKGDYSRNSPHLGQKLNNIGSFGQVLVPKFDPQNPKKVAMGQAFAILQLGR